MLRFTALIALFQQVASFSAGMSTNMGSSKACNITYASTPNIDPAYKYYYGCENWHETTSVFPVCEMNNVDDGCIRRFCIDKCTVNPNANLSMFNMSDPMQATASWYASNCNNSKAIMQPQMWWTGYPKPSNNIYVMEVKDASGQIATMYAPDEWLTITIRVTVAKKNFKGLLMYAVTSDDSKKVGAWDLPPEPETQLFGLGFDNATEANPVGFHYCPNSVMHNGATAKPYITTFYFKGPPANTGKIFIKAMVKDGPPNPTSVGDFYVLDFAGLNEKPSIVPSIWKKGYAGQTCDQFCEAQWKATNGNSTQTANFCSSANPSVSEMKAIRSQVGCHNADLKACNLPFSGVGLNANRLCYDHQSAATCTTDSKAFQAAKCCSSHALVVPICACNSNTDARASCAFTSPTLPVTAKPTLQPTFQQMPTTATVFNPTAPTAGSNPTSATGSNPTTSATGSDPLSTDLNAGQKMSPSLVAFALAAMGLKDSKSFLVASLFIAATQVRADNWLEGSRGRSQSTSLTAPTFPLTNPNNIHLQVAPGQEFIIEWASAHGGNTYFVLLKAEDEKYLSKIDTKMLDTYLKNCPLNDNGFDKDPRWGQDNINKTAVEIGNHPVLQKFKRIGYNFDYESTTNITALAPFLRPFDYFSKSLGGGPVLPGDKSFMGHRPVGRFRSGIGDGMGLAFTTTSCPKKQNSTEYLTDNPDEENCTKGNGRLFTVNSTGNISTQYRASYQLRYATSKRTTDARCAYSNSNYSYIRSAHRFFHPNIVGNNDAAMMTIGLPGDGSAAGRYILWYYWSGYRDNIDIDVVNPNNPVIKAQLIPDLKYPNLFTTTLPYGKPSTVANFDRLDHCIFEDPKAYYGSCVQVLPGKLADSQCQDICSKDTTCLGYMLVPFSQSNLAFPDSTPIPWRIKTNMSLPTNIATNPVIDNPKCNKASFSPGQQVCVMINRFNSDDNGGPVPYTFFTDMSDIGFYSTCFLRRPAFTFAHPITPLSSSIGPFRFNDKCIPCEDRQLTKVFPDWKQASTCYDCDLEDPLNALPFRNSTEPARPWATAMAYNGSKLMFNDSAINSAYPSGQSSALKILAVAGSLQASDFECRYLMGMDASCSSYAYVVPFTAPTKGIWITAVNASVAMAKANCVCLLKASYDAMVAAIPDMNVTTLIASKMYVPVMGNTGGAIKKLL